MQKLVVYLAHQTVYEVLIDNSTKVGDVLGMLEKNGFEVVGYEVLS